MSPEALLKALSDRLLRESMTRRHTDDRTKSYLLAEVFAWAAEEYRSGDPSQLASAVLRMAQQGRHLVEEVSGS